MSRGNLLAIASLWFGFLLLAVRYYPAEPIVATIITLVATPHLAIGALYVLGFLKKPMEVYNPYRYAWWHREQEFKAALGMLVVSIIYGAVGIAGICYGLEWGQNYLLQMAFENLRAYAAVAGGGIVLWAATHGFSYAVVKLGENA